VALGAVLPPEHPYSHPVIGTTPGLVASTLPEAQRFVRERYRPEHTTLVVAGDVTPEDVLRLLFKTFPLTAFHPDLKLEHIARISQDGGKAMPWALDPGNPDKALAMGRPVVRYHQPHERLESGALVSRKADIEERTLAVSWMLPPLDARTLRATPSMVGRVASMLAGEALSEARHVGRPDCRVFDLRRGAMLLCFVELEDKADPQAVYQRVAGMGDRTVRVPDAYRSERVAWARVLNLESLERIAGASRGRTIRIAEHVHEGHPADYLRESDTMARTTTYDAIPELRGRAMWKATSTGVVLLPVDEEQVVQEETRPGCHAAPRDAMATPRTPEARGLLPDDRIVVRELKNGLTVVAIDQGQMPLVTAALVVPKGSHDAPPGVDSLAEGVKAWRVHDGGNRFLRRPYPESDGRLRPRF